MVQPEELSERKIVTIALGIDSLTFSICCAVSQTTAPQCTLSMKKNIIKFDIKFCLLSPVNDFLQTVRDILIYLVLFSLYVCTQYYVQCNFTDDSENHAVSILNLTTVFLYRISENDSKTRCLYADPSGRVVEAEYL